MLAARRGAEFVLTHEPPDSPDPGVTFLTGDIGEAVATALDAGLHTGGSRHHPPVPRPQVVPG